MDCCSVASDTEPTRSKQKALACGGVNYITQYKWMVQKENLYCEGLSSGISNESSLLEDGGLPLFSLTF